MRRGATWALVAGIAVVGVAAVIDGVRGGGESAPQIRSLRAPATDRSPAVDLARAGVSGSLYVTSSAGRVCVVRVIELPATRVSTSTGLSTCRFEVSPDGREVAEARRCPGARSAIRNILNLTGTGSFVGCAPAWKPDGTLTYVRSGDIVAERLDCLARVGCADVLLSSDEAGGTLSSVAWLDNARFAAAVRVDRRRYEIVIFERGERRELIDFPFRTVPAIDPVAGGRELAVRARATGVMFLDYRGRFAAPQRVPFRDVAAVAESPDGRWLAMARPGNVCIHRAQDGRLPVECIPLSARDLAWR